MKDLYNIRISEDLIQVLQIVTKFKSIHDVIFAASWYLDQTSDP